ncbi:hypothetical protein DFH07DRAFT_699441, partial [Mycena maculata]
SIGTLPEELLGEIFTHCAAIYPNAPLLLGEVSRIFRHVVHTTPSAWSNLELDSTDTDERGIIKTTSWLAQSKACRIAVKIIIHMPAAGNGKTEPNGPAVPAALEILRHHTGRIDALCLRTDTQAQACAALSVVYGEGTADTGLSSLRICVASMAVPTTLTFPPIPSIIELETTNVALSALPALGATQLEILRIVQPLISPPVAAEDVLELARFAPRLRSLYVETRISDPVAKPETRLLPQLQDLQLRVNNVVPFLDQLIVPSLRSMHLNDLDGGRASASSETGAALHRLLVRMELCEGYVHHLRVFKLVGVAVDPADPSWERCFRKNLVLEVFS